MRTRDPAKRNRYPAVKAWRKANTSRYLAQNRSHQKTYRGEAGSLKREEYNAAQYLRAVRRRARRAAAKALAVASERAADLVQQRKEKGYTGPLRLNG